MTKKDEAQPETGKFGVRNVGDNDRSIFKNEGTTVDIDACVCVVHAVWVYSCS